MKQTWDNWGILERILVKEGIGSKKKWTQWAFVVLNNQIVCSSLGEITSCAPRFTWLSVDLCYIAF